MKAQCPCVTGPDKIANPHCPVCDGEGTFEVSFPDESDLEAVWIGRCPQCGASNGAHLQKVGQPKPAQDQYWRCINLYCSKPPVEFVTAGNTIEWLAVCSICGTGHYADFLQRAGEASPTLETHPRTCPNENCASPQMMWFTLEELEEQQAIDPL